SGIPGPRGTLISLEGMHIPVKVLELYLDGNMFVQFDHNFTGKDMCSRRVVKMVDFKLYSGCAQDIQRLLALSKCTFMVVRQDFVHMLNSQMYITTSDNHVIDICSVLPYQFKVTVNNSRINSFGLESRNSSKSNNSNSNKTSNNNNNDNNTDNS